MMWQDLVLALGNVLLGYALIPQVIFGFRNKKKTILFKTGVVMQLGLILVLIVFLSQKLFISSGILLVSLFGWFLLSIQSIIYSNKK